VARRGHPRSADLSSRGGIPRYRWDSGCRGVASRVRLQSPRGNREDSQPRGVMHRSTVRRSVFVVLVAITSSAWFVSSATASTGPAVVGAVSNATTLSGTMAVAVSGNFAYTASYWSGQLNVFDMSNPANPTLVASTPSTPGLTDATNITIAGHYALVTSKNRNASPTSNDDGTGNSLTVVDISTPTAPTVVGTVHGTALSPQALFGAYAVAVSGNYAFVASQGLLSGQPASPDTSAGSFAVIDLTSPSSPTVVANIDNASLSGSLTDGLDHATGVSIDGHYAYVTAYSGQRLTTIDISNPTSPAVVASLHDATNLALPNDVATQGNYAYIANQVASGMEFTAVNISNPLAPAVVGSVSDPTLKGAYRVRLNGNFAYVSANSASSVAAIDISNPSAPKLAGVVTDPHLDNVDGLAVSGTGQYLIATAPRLQSDPAVTNPPYPLAGGPAITGTVSVIAVSVAIAPASEPANPTPQQSASFSLTTNDAAAAVTCSLDHAAFAPCTSATTADYSSLASGSHTFTVQATDSIGLTDQATYTWTVVNAAPVNTSLPTISGTAQQGHKLTAVNGLWSGSPTPTFGYQWQRCNAKGKSCKAISKQTNNTYTATTADVGSRLEVIVTATNLAGSANATSAATKIVTWSSSAFATATLSSSKTTSPGIILSIPSPASNLKLSKLIISLPSGLSFRATRQALAAGSSVRDLHGKRLSFTASLSHGKLTLTFKKPPTGVKLTVARGLLSISNALERRIRSHKAKTRVSLTLTYTGKPSRTGAIRLRLA
jgi:hypothetical protein